MPSRRMTANSSTCVPMPTPRLARSPLERSNTVTSQPAWRSNRPANNPPSEPPMISARAIAGQPVRVGQDPAVPFFGRSERLEPVARGHGGLPGKTCGGTIALLIGVGARLAARSIGAIRSPTTRSGPMKIAAMAAGAVGGYFGARMQAAGHDVSFIARGAHLDAIRKNGLSVESVHGNLHLPKVNVTDDPAEVGPVDIVLFAVKLWDTETAAQAARPLL